MIALSYIQAVAVSAGFCSGAVLGASTYHFIADLTVGSSGPDVVALQQYLNAGGYTIPAGATGYFGEQIRAALAAYQAANGILPAAGYFGPATRALVNQGSAKAASPTSAMTIAQMQALLAQLVAQLAALEAQLASTTKA